MSDPNEITDLLKIITRLTGVLEREIEMLRAMKPSEIQALQQDKLVLTAAYEARIKSLKDNPQTLRDLPAELRAALRETIGGFQTTLAENERRLRAARDVSDRVLRAIADELEQRQNNNKGYAPAGAFTGRPAGGRQPVSVAFDERL